MALTLPCLLGARRGSAGGRGSEEKPTPAALPRFSSLDAGGSIMVSKFEMSSGDLLEKLHVISAHVGLSEDDIIDLLDSGVTVTSLLNYLEAAASNRLD
jgi:hypothetical protein